MLAESDEAFGRALELMAPGGNDALAGAWVRRGHWLRGGICHPRESLRSYHAALDFLYRASQADADPMVRAEALAGMAWALAVAGDPNEVDKLLTEAELAAHAAGLTGARPDLLRHDVDVTRAHALLRAGRFTQSYQPLVAASIAAGRAGRPDLAYSCLANAASAAASASNHHGAAAELGLALDLGAPVSRPVTRLRRAAELARAGRLDDAERELRAVALEPVSAADLPDTLVARMCHVQGLVAIGRGQPELAARWLREAQAGWLRRADRGGDAGEGYAAALLAAAEGDH